MKLAFVSPLPPQPTAVAHHAAEILPHLRRLAEVQLFVQEPAFTPAEYTQAFAVRPLADLPSALQRGEVDLPVYQLGNSRWHATALRYVREQPGLVVLHDLVLHHLLAMLTLERGFLDAYRDLLVADHGPKASGWAERLARADLTDGDRRRRFDRLPLSRALTGHARGVVAHSRQIADKIARWHPDLPVRHLPYPAALPVVDRAAARQRLGLAAADFAVALLGPADEPCDLDDAALTGFAGAGPNAKLLVFAPKDAAAASRLAAAGLLGRAQFLGRTPHAVAVANLAAADAAIALRTKAGGGTAEGCLRAMSVGVPFVTLAAGAGRELPAAAGRLLAPSRHLGRELAATLQAWQQDAAARGAAGRAGRTAIERDHDPAAFAAQLVAFAEELRQRPGRPAAVPKLPSVEAITICYNGRKFIGASIQSMLDQDYPNLKVTVIDNASADGSAEYIRQNFPQVDLIASPDNLGFSGGNNEVFRRSRADWFALLNQDAVARRNWISEMVAVGRQSQDIAVVGAKMLMQQCPTIVNSAGIAMNEAAWAVDRWIGLRDDQGLVAPEEIIGVCGGALMIRAEVYRRFGGFDDTYFMYFEDVDLCWRYWLAGQRVLYVPTAVVHHDWHGDRTTIDRLKRRRYLCERNRWQTLFKNAELRTIRKLWFKVRAYDRARLRVVREMVGRGENVDYFAMVGEAIRSAFRWNMMHLPSLWKRRRQGQRHRRVGDAALRRLLEPGIGEPTHVGNLEAVRDRFSAKPVPRISMGRTDGDCLGPGWYGLEGDPKAAHQWRWSMPGAWFYLRPERDARRLCLEVAGRPLAGDLELWLDGEPAGSQRVHQNGTVRFELPRPVPAGAMLEACCRIDGFRPRDLDQKSGDVRDLGICVGEIWTE